MSVSQPKTLYAPTDDGWRLALHHWPAAGQRRRHPVMMVHGLFANRLNLDLDKRYSVARAAARRGFDVYVLELRGAGLSIAPGGRDRGLFQWGFLDYLHRDYPAAMATALEHSGARALHGLGHSMGGMLFYALGSTRAPQLCSVTAVGSPLLFMAKLGTRERRLLRLAVSLTPNSTQRRVPLRRLFGAAGRFIPLSSRIADGLLLNAANCEPEVMARMAKEGINDVPVQIVLELTRQVFGNGKEGAYAHEAHLGRVEVPALVVAGAVDRIAPAAAVAAAAVRLGSRDVRYREMGKQFGDRADYGHIDLLVGTNAPEEVFPLILDFLEEVD